jgi:hypothetical protein
MPYPLSVTNVTQGSRLSIKSTENEASFTSLNNQEAVTTSTAPHILASKAASATAIALNAVEAIIDLRKQQEALAVEAQSTSNPTIQQSLQDQLEAFDTEIARIMSEATDENGENVLSGKSYLIYENLTFTIGDFQSIAGASEVDISSTAGAAAAEETLGALTQLAVSAGESVRGSFDRAQNILEETTVSYAPSVTDSEEVEQLSQSIASQLSQLHSPTEVHLLNYEMLISSLLTNG